MDTQIISPVSRDWLRRPLSGKVIQSRLKSDQPSGQEALPELIQSFFILLSSSFSLFPRTPATPLPQSLVCWCRCLGGSSHEAGSRTSGCLRSRGQASLTATSIVEVRARATLFATALLCLPLEHWENLTMMTYMYLSFKLYFSPLECNFQESEKLSS